MLDGSRGCQVLLEIRRGDAHGNDLPGAAEPPRFFAVDRHGERRGITGGQNDGSAELRRRGVRRSGTRARRRARRPRSPTPSMDQWPRPRRLPARMDRARLPGCSLDSTRPGSAAEPPDGARAREPDGLARARPATIRRRRPAPRLSPAGRRETAAALGRRLRAQSLRREPVRGFVTVRRCGVRRPEIQEPGDDRHADRDQAQEGRGSLLVAVVLLFFFLLLGRRMRRGHRQFGELRDELLDGRRRGRGRPGAHTTARRTG